jgi:digeranylgeranylglycerophospholipid reductase
MYDVVVVGAGPCGSAAARECAELGLRTLLLEEHASIGSPVQCAGLLSNAAFDECRVSKASILHSISGARVISGSDSGLTFDTGEIQAVVVDRGALDREMARAAACAGARIALKTAAKGLDGHEVITVGADGRRRIPCRIIIAADGPRSVIARSAGFERSLLYFSGIQAEIPHEMDGRYVELHPNASPDFFGWVIPSGEGRARVGLCGLEHVQERFAAFRRGFDPRCLHLVSGVIPIGVRPRTCGNRVLLVGDAAGFAKPTSGGGIYTGVRSARLAAEVAAECCSTGQFDDTALGLYEQRWKQDFGNELSTGLRFLKLRMRMSPESVEEVCRILNDPDIIEMIVRYGDMDRPGELIRRLIRKPEIFRRMKGIVRSEIKEFMRC